MPQNEIHHNGITWVDIQDPKQKDIRHLKENFSFHDIVLEELIPPGHRPKVEAYEDYLFMVIYYPAFSKAKKETFARELDIIITKDRLITSHYRTILPLKVLFDHINLYDESKAQYMSESTGHLLFYLIRSILENAFTKLDHIEEEVDRIEDEIFNGKERKMVFEISEAKRDIIDFRRILAPQSSVFDSLAQEGTKFFGDDLAPHFHDLRGSFGLIWNELQEHRETLQALAETNESLLSTKFNEIIRVLTIFSVVLLPLTLIASIWGMNVEKMPLTGDGSFWYILGIMGGMSIMMLGYFMKKRWL
jgi:magnesium transporter